MRRLVRYALIGLLVLVAYGLYRSSRGPAVPEGSIVVLDLEGDYVEAAEAPLLARLVGQERTPFLRLYSDLRKAERDARISAVVLRIRSLGIGWAKAQEIRDALVRLRQAGRRTVAYLELEPIGANLEYYIASAAERVYVAPGTRIPFVGLAAEYLFLGGLWDKLGVDLEVERVGPHKTAADFFAGRGMSEAHREMANWLLDSLESQFVQGIAAARGIRDADVRAAIVAAPSDPKELEARHLVDGAAYLSDVLKELGEERNVIEQKDWSRAPAAHGFAPGARVALVYGSGNVVTGDGDRTPGGGPVLASQTVADALTEAAEDDDIDAILFRIDSPGGSALASDLVWHATQVARREKPLVVSFSDVAASGGYYVACGADAIVAQPGTITGSIGVLTIRPVVRRLYEKLGISVETLKRGPHAELFVLSENLDPEERARLGADVEQVYQLFVERVSAGRALEREKIEAVARGRVWTGEQALERGLVDQLGGLHAAVARVRESLKLAPEADVELVVYPPPKPLALELRELLLSAAHGGGVLPRALPGPMRQLASWLETLPLGAPLLLPSLVLEVR